MRRKCRRMMAFTSDRLYVVRVDDGKAKASYPLKSVQLAPSDKVNPASFRLCLPTLFALRYCCLFVRAFVEFSAVSY